MTRDELIEQALAVTDRHMGGYHATKQRQRAAVEALADAGLLADPGQHAELEEWRAAGKRGGDPWPLHHVREALGTPPGRAVGVHAKEVRAERDLALWLHAEATHCAEELTDFAGEQANARRESDRVRNIAAREAADLRDELDTARTQLAEKTEYAGEKAREGDVLSLQVDDLTAERDALQARLATIVETLARAAGMMATDSRDWGRDRSDVWLYGLIVAWECEEQHEHDDVMCGSDEALREVAERHGWTADDVARIRRFRAALQGDQPEVPRG